MSLRCEEDIKQFLILCFVFVSIESSACDLTPIKTFSLGTGWTYDFDLSHDGKYLAIGESKKASLWNLRNGSLAGIVDVHGRDVTDVVFDPVKEELLTGTRDGKLSRWRIPDASFISEISAHKGTVSALAISSDGTLLFSGSHDKRILIHETKTGCLLTTLEGHPWTVDCLAVTKDSSLLFSGDMGTGSLCLWDLSTSSLLWETNPALSDVYDIKMLPQGPYALSTHLKQRVILWDLQQREEIARYLIPGNPWRQNKPLSVNSIGVTADGSIAALALAYGEIVFLDLNSWCEIGRFQAHGTSQEFVSFLDDSHVVTVGSEVFAGDLEARIWNVDSLFQKSSRTRTQGAGSILTNMQHLDTEGGILFEDKALEWIIRDKIGCPFGVIYPNDLVAISELNAASSGISAIGGLEYCTALSTLDLSFNMIENLRPISALTNLKKLDLSYNHIVSLSPISKLTGLTSLDLHQNQIVDISPLSSLRNIEFLNLASNQIVDIDTLYYIVHKGSIVSLVGNPLDSIASGPRLIGLRSLEAIIIF